MATVVMIAYESEAQAQAVRRAVLRMQKENRIDLADAVVVARDDGGMVHLHPLYNYPAAGAVGGGLCGLLVGARVRNPLLGVALGAAIGAACGALCDTGIDHNRLRQVGESLEPGTAALCLLIRHMTRDLVAPIVQQFGGTIRNTSLGRDHDANRGVAPAAGLQPTY